MLNKLLRRIFLVDLIKGMELTFRYQHPKNIYTEQYPLERPMVAERYRGAPRLNINPDTGESVAEGEQGELVLTSLTREAMPLIVINCVALTETLLENELFGHERGAFTGADRQQKGKLEMADGGTVFLDEIGDMPLTLQAKLLRVLQDREFQRVGGSKTVSVNIRIIAATNRDLRQAVKTGQFREDLYFRLNVVTLTLPPLRERQGDVPALAQFFLERHTRDAKRTGMVLSPAAVEALTRYPWPGNIRELDNVIARAVVLSPKDTIEPDMLALLSEDADLRHPHLPEDVDGLLADGAAADDEGPEILAGEGAHPRRGFGG